MVPIAEKYARTFTSMGVKSSLLRSSIFFRSMFRYSNTRYRLLSAITTSYKATIDSWSMSFSREISRMAVDGMPSESVLCFDGYNTRY